MLGHPMLLRTLGFRNMLDMIREMPDVVYIDYLEDGSLVLKTVADDTTRGIVELVARQRSANKAPAWRGGVGFFSQCYQEHNPMVLPQHGHAPPALPAQLRAQLRQLLSQGAVGLSELETAFARHYGFPLRVTNYGFYSIAGMLLADADLVAVTQSRTGSLLPLRGGGGGATDEDQTKKATLLTEADIPNGSRSKADDRQTEKQTDKLSGPYGPERDQGSQPMEYTNQSEPEPTQNRQLFQKCVTKVRGKRLRAPTPRGPQEPGAPRPVEHDDQDEVNSNNNNNYNSPLLDWRVRERNMRLPCLSGSCYTCPEVMERYRLPERYVRPCQVCRVVSQGIWFYHVVVHWVLSDTLAEVYYKLCCERTLVVDLHSYHASFLQLFLCDRHTQEDGGQKAIPFAALQSKNLLLCCSDWNQGWTPNPTTTQLKPG
ncbi:unnamed protein product [Coregonus sp. 'balchen']|nr:unnamed protein product [Coregonus sp. 'balchen']